jgi:hypothetical protein
VPSQDGTDIFAGIQGLDACETVCVEPGWDPAPAAGSLTPVPQCCATAPCWLILPGLPPEEDVHTSIDVTWPPDSRRTVDLIRAYVPSPPRTLHSGDGALRWTLVNTDTLPSATYVTIAPHAIPPGPAPDAHEIAGSAYSVRAAGALLTLDRPASLHLAYQPEQLGDADPHTLGIYVWNAYHAQWTDLGGRLLYDQQTLAVPTPHLATYALIAAPSWRDGFADDSGLDPDQTDNVVQVSSTETAQMVLANTPGDGSATSRTIVPPAPIARWDTLTYDHLAGPPTTTLTVDVLDAEGNVLLASVDSGADLSSLDPDQHPTLKLSVTMSSTAPGQTPALSQWRLAWTPLPTPVQSHNQYFPLTLCFFSF